MSDGRHPEIDPEQTAAIILAGGQGSRIRDLIGELPKPMVAVRGRPFIEWVLRWVTRQGVRRVFVSTGYQSPVIEAHFRERRLPRVRVDCIREGEPLGTGGAVRHVLDRCGESHPLWLILNGDSLVATQLLPLWAALADPAAVGSMLGVRVTDASRYGTIACDRAGYLTRFLEKRPGTGVINGGVYLLRQAALTGWPAQVPLSLEREVFPLLARRRVRVKVWACEAPFLDIGTPVSLAQAEHFLRQHGGSWEGDDPVESSRAQPAEGRDAGIA